MQKEEELFNEVFGSARKNKVKETPVNFRNTELRPSSASARPSNAAFMATMTKRLNQLEKKCKLLQVNVEEKNRKILQLESNGGRNSDELVKENRDLKAKLESMEVFLLDYGLTFVGGEKVQVEPVVEEERVEIYFDVEELLTQIDNLNKMAGEGKVVIQSLKGNGQMHKFVHREGVPFSIYKDGIMLRRGPFRKYADKATKQFIHDILDGFYPYEFKDSHPDGVILNVRDKREEYYAEFEAFTGQGNRAGDKFRGFAQLGDAEIELNTKEFLNRLPESVIKDGQVIPIRADIAERVGEAPKEKKVGPIIVETPAVIDGSTTNVSTLQIRMDNGVPNLIIKLYYNDSIRTLRKYITTYRELKEDYEIRTTYPNKAYCNVAETIEQAGLVPNAAIIIRTIR